MFDIMLDSTTASWYVFCQPLSVCHRSLQLLDYLLIILYTQLYSLKGLFIERDSWFLAVHCMQLLCYINYFLHGLALCLLTFLPCTIYSVQKVVSTNTARIQKQHWCFKNKAMIRPGPSLKQGWSCSWYLLIYKRTWVYLLPIAVLIGIVLL